MLVSTLINSAARKINVIASGETMSAAEQQDFLAGLQSMLRSWSAEKLNVFTTVDETFTLVSGTATYTWGSGGTINTARPNQVLRVTVDSGGVTYPVEIVGEDRYNAISVKTTTGRPYTLFPKYEFPYAQIILYPVPNSTDTLNLFSLKPFTETSSFDSVDSTIQVPVTYEEPIIYNLAIRMAPEFGKSVSREVAVIADSSYNRIIHLNAANYIEPIVIVIPAGAHGGYNINSDSYR